MEDPSGTGFGTMFSNSKAERDKWVADMIAEMQATMADNMEQIALAIKEGPDNAIVAEPVKVEEVGVAPPN